MFTLVTSLVLCIQPPSVSQWATVYTFIHTHSHSGGKQEKSTVISISSELLVLTLIKYFVGKQVVY